MSLDDFVRDTLKRLDMLGGDRAAREAIKRLEVPDRDHAAREAMKRLDMLGGDRAAREAIKRLEVPDRDRAAREAMKRLDMLGGDRAAREAIKRLEVPDRDRATREAMKRLDMLGGDRAAREAIKRLEVPDRDRATREAMKRLDLMRDVERHCATLDSFKRSDMFRQFERTFTDGFRRFDEIRGLVSELRSRQTTDFSQDETISTEDVAEAESVLESDEFKALASLPAQASYLVERAERDAGLSTTARFILLYIILPIICNLVATRIDYIITYLRPTQTVQQVRRLADELSLTQEQTDELRIASRDGLPVYARRNGKSQILGHLDLGQVVILMAKRGKWCLIASSSGQGWVRSKYLERLRR
jgi:hypothetical protein